MRINKAQLNLAMLKAGVKDQKDLAARANMHPNTISNMMRGATVKLETIGKLAAALEVDPADIIQDDTPRN